MKKQIGKIRIFAVCALLFSAGLFALLGFGGINRANAAQDDSQSAKEYIENGDLEKTSGAMPTGWFYWMAKNDPAYTGVASVGGYVVTGDEAYEGNSVKLVNNSESDTIRAVLNNDVFKVESGKSYLFSFVYKSTANTQLSVCMRQYRAYNASTGNTTDTRRNTYTWLNGITTIGSTDGWKKLSAVVTAESDAKYMRVQMDLMPTIGGAGYFDNFSLVEIDVNQMNAGFERTEGSDMLLGWVSSDSSCFEFSDDVVYDGKSSIRIRRNDLASAFSLESIARYSALSARSYDLGVYIRSQNSEGVKATVQATFYNNSGSVVKTFNSPYFFLKNGAGLSDWTKVWMRVTAPQNSYFVSLKFSLSSGKTDCYVDGAFCYDSTNTVYLQDFDNIEDGNVPDGFTGDDITVKEGKLVVPAGKTAEIVLDSLLYKYGYTFNGKCVSADGGVPEITIEWIDFRGNKLSETRFESKNLTEDFLVEFIAAQGTTAKFIFANTGKGTVSFDDLRIDRTYDPRHDKDGWQAYWVSYPFADVAYGGAEQTAYFRYTFELTEEVESAQIQLTGDDVTTTYVNGEMLSDPGKKDWAKVLVTQVGSYLQKGKNVLAFDIYNDTYYGGLLFDMEVTMKSGKKLRFYSDDTVVSALSVSDGWTEVDYDDKDWKKIYIIGKPPCMPWGEIVYKKNAELLPSLSFTNVKVPEQVNAGDIFEFSFDVTPAKEITTDITMRVNFRDEYEADENETMEIWIIPTLVSGKRPSEWKVGEKTSLTYRMLVPDYLQSGSYHLQFDTSEFIITDRGYENNILHGEYFQLNASEKIELTESEVVKNGDKVQLKVNGEVVAPMMYLREQTTVFKTEYASGMGGAGVDLFCLPNCRSYNMNNSGSMWLGNGKYDFAPLDNVVYETLQGSPTAKLMLMLDADPPSWWLAANPDAYAVDSKGKKVGVSYASSKWRMDVGNYFEALINYVLRQPYAGHIFAVKFSAGATFEWQYYGVSLDACADFGKDAQAAFRNWLKKKYLNDEGLRAAWNNSSVTLETANVPSYEQRKATTYKTLLDGKAQRNVIDFHLFQSDMTTDSILYFADLIKSACNDKWIVGTYTGYSTHGQTYESNGLANAALDRVLKSSSVDFLCSPICYDERLLAMSASYMMMVDSVIAAGKLPIIECDSRTVYYENSSDPSLLGEWGKTYTLKDSIEALKRDFANMMIKGAGLWWYDMYGGWFNDPEIYSMFTAAYNEWQLAVENQAESTSRIAFIAGDNLATTLAYDFDGTYHYLYESMYSQKESLGHIGTSYDMLLTSDVVDGLDRDYDVYIVLAANLSEAEKQGINKYIKKNGKTVIWVGFPGIYGEDGEMTAKNVSALTDIELSMLKTSTYGVSIVENGSMTKGLDGLVYGRITSSAVSPMLCVTDEEAETLGYICNSKSVGLAAKAVRLEEGGAYISIYSSVGNIPSELLRNILKGYGVSLAGDENDVVFRNENYIAIASTYGGERTIELGKVTDVYDVFKGEYIAKNVSSVTVKLEKGTTTLLRTAKYSDSEKPDDNDSGDYSDHGKTGCACSSSVELTIPFFAGVIICAVCYLIVRIRKTIKTNNY